MGGFNRVDSDDSYVLLGGGGHKLESDLSVASAGSARVATILGKWTDNRSTDNLPSYYYENSLGGCGAVSSELAYAGSAHGWYETRITTVPWWDTSGGRPVQLALANSGAYLRTAASRTQWNPWQTIVTSANIRNYAFNLYDAEIEYLESTGTQWINTLYKPNNNTRITCDFQYTTSNDYPRIFGCSSGTAWNSAPSFQLNFETGVTTGKLGVVIGNNTAWSRVDITGDFNRHTYDLNITRLIYDGGQVATYSDQTFQCTANLAIFVRVGTDYTPVSTEFAIGKLYSFKIYENDLLVRDFIPVRVYQVGYLYDKVSGQLFGNVGTGDFVLGQDIGPCGGHKELSDFAMLGNNHDDRYRLRNGVYAYYPDGTFRTYEDADTNAMAAALITDRLSILIDKTDFYGDQLPDYGYSWQVVGGSSPLITDQTTAELDYNGKTNTDKMIADYPNGVGAYVRTRLNGTGYIPAFGELKEIYNNRSSVSSMLVKIGGTAYDWNSNQHKCSSTAYSTSGIWTIQWYSSAVTVENTGVWTTSSNFCTFRAVAKIPNY